ncbi:MAG TPA: tRNA (N(6)-L-threonylcarbamoyladenosine(37)-C(2))-methylthiotransferase MtaB [Enhygromyxa sp.]|nr:tRNA (N(6)-L-threonylcarbamoyladenosine(37)-C(2))-methylthiotransferase MtaB [Enhygromyxa sp.]
MRFAVETHGCRLNQAETDALVAQLEARGHERVGVEQAELYLLNSCAITHEADADARAAIRRARRKNPSARLVITGCHANAEPDQLAAMPELAAVLGNGEKQGLALLDRLDAIAEPSAVEKLIAVEQLTRRVRARAWSHPAAATPGRSRPLLKIQDGCDYQCSFCIVPQVRGRSRSVAPEQVLAQLQQQVAAGAAEVVLTGAHLGLWGRELGGGSRLADLLERLLAEVPEARLRLGSVDPHEVDEPLIGLLGRGVDEHGRGLCQHIHLPIQAGDDGVLRAMRRAHTVADLERLVPRLRAAAPGIALGTDVIVGFPGESDEAFERTLALFEAQAIPLAHVFVWSPRSGVPAIDLPGRVSASTAAQRSRALRQRVAASRAQFIGAQIGTERSAVILRRRARRSGALVALTDNYLKLEVTGPDALLGRRVRVEVESPSAGRLRL